MVSLDFWNHNTTASFSSPVVHFSPKRYQEFSGPADPSINDSSSVANDSLPQPTGEVVVGLAVLSNGRQMESTEAEA
jgi:hypothetical protein